MNDTSAKTMHMLFAKVIVKQRPIYNPLSSRIGPQAAFNSDSTNYIQNRP